MRCPVWAPYTARAVRSFAFGADVATVDTNALRVLSRCVAGAGLDAGRRPSRWPTACCRPGRSWEFNQTMFDLGATVCTAAPPCLRALPLAPTVPLAAQGPARAGPVAGQSLGAPAGPLRRLGPAGSRPVGPRAAPGRRSPARCWPRPAGGPTIPRRADRITAPLVAEGFAEWTDRPRPRRVAVAVTGHGDGWPPVVPSCPSTGIVGVVNVTFYGVRGSCPCSGDRYRRYGGNTSCLVIEIEGDEPLIVDLGTGLRALGDELLKRRGRWALRCMPPPS